MLFTMDPESELSFFLKGVRLGAYGAITLKARGKKVRFFSLLIGALAATNVWPYVLKARQHYLTGKSRLTGNSALPVEDASRPVMREPEFW